MLNTIYNEDCQTRIKRIPDNYVDLVIIDPPSVINNHNTTYKSELSKYMNSYNDELYINNLTSGYDYKILEEILRVLKKK